MDAIDARVVFNSSTGVALLIIGLLIILVGQVQIENYVKPPLLTPKHFIVRTFITIVIILVGITLILSAYFEFQNVRIPLVCQLLKENNVDDHPSDCKEYNQKKEQNKEN